MKKYYLKTGNRERGPYILDDLKYQRISPDTLVKIDEGMWKPISEESDLRFLLQHGHSGKDSYSSANSDHQQNSSSIHQSFKSNKSDVKPNVKMVIVLALAAAIFAMGLAIFIFASTAR